MNVMISGIEKLFIPMSQQVESSVAIETKLDEP